MTHYSIIIDNHVATKQHFGRIRNSAMLERFKGLSSLVAKWTRSQLLDSQAGNEPDAPAW
jgi:hypothetical protein